MPMYNDLTWKKVPVAAGTITYNYIFGTKVLTGVSTDLGHVAVTGTNGFYTLGNLEILGANLPKPMILSKKGATGGSSYADPAQVSTAIAGGYVRRAAAKMGLPRAQTTPSGTGRGSSIAVKVATSNGVNFAWRMPGEQYVKISGDLASLGITVLSSRADWNSAVFGATYPRAARVRKVLDAGTDGEDIITTFCDASKLASLPAGWSLVQPEQLTFAVS